MNKQELIALLEEAGQYIGLAACHGYKCRLPHCMSCCGEDAADIGEEFENKLYSAIARAKAELEE